MLLILSTLIKHFFDPFIRDKLTEQISHTAHKDISSLAVIKLIHPVIVKCWLETVWISSWKSFCHCSSIAIFTAMPAACYWIPCTVTPLNFCFLHFFCSSCSRSFLRISSYSSRSKSASSVVARSDPVFICW